VVQNFNQRGFILIAYRLNIHSSITSQMKKILLSLVLGIRLFSAFGQTNPTPTKIVFGEKTPTLLYRKAEDQKVSIYIDKKVDTGIVNAIVKASIDVPNKPSESITLSPWKLTFGSGYPESYVLSMDLKKDTSIKVPSLITVTIMIDGNTDIINHHNIFFQPSTEVEKSTEAKLIKSNEEIKADINMLRSQLLNGDTSRTYIGKLSINKIASIVPYGAQGVLSKKNVDNLIKTSKISDNDEYPVSIDKGKKDANNKNIINEGVITKRGIDQVVVKVSEGVVEFLKVIMTDGSYYYNQKAPIPLLNIEDRFTDKLVNPYDSSFVFVADILNFDVNRRFNYFPSEGTFYLNQKKSVESLYANNGLNSFVDIRIFTDLLAAIDNQPNGLLQVEAKSKIYLHRHNISESFMFLFDGIEPYLGLSKLDSKYDTVKMNATTGSINRMDLYQRSFLNVGLKLNVFHWDFRPSNKLFINAGYQFNSSNISIRDQANKADSVVAKGTFHSPYFEGGIISKRLEGFGFEGSARYMFQLLNSNKHFSNSGYTHLMDFNVTAFYFVGKASRDKFFARFSNVLNFKDRKEDFYQLQFGYSLNLKI
jgi:hypothetical protein